MLINVGHINEIAESYASIVLVLSGLGNRWHKLKSS